MGNASATLRDCERWFVRRGVPHLMEDYDAGEDIWTRSLPVLVPLYALRGLYALDLEQSLRFNLVTLVLVAGVLVATWILANVVRGRPPFSWPRQVDPPELAVFVLGPAIPPLLLGQWADAVKTTLLGLVVLGVVYLATSYGLVPMFRWAGKRALALATSLGSVLSRALPLLLLVITFLFFTAEVWQTIGTLTGLAYLLRAPALLPHRRRFRRHPPAGRRQCSRDLGVVGRGAGAGRGDPGRSRGPPGHGAPPAPELSRRQYVNVALVGLFARTIQIVAVALAVGTFLVLLGTLAISEETVAAWTTSTPDVLVAWTLAGRELVVTAPLLRVAGFLATFAALTFTVSLVTDPTYRVEFRTDMASEVREVFAVRAAYLVARATA